MAQDPLLFLLSSLAALLNCQDMGLKDARKVDFLTADATAPRARSVRGPASRERAIILRQWGRFIEEHALLILSSRRRRKPPRSTVVACRGTRSTVRRGSLVRTGVRMCASSRD